MTGFGAVPDELRQTAGVIGDVVSGVAGVTFRGPSGDYGHAGVQAGWTEFLAEPVLAPEPARVAVRLPPDLAGADGAAVHPAAAGEERTT